MRRTDSFWRGAIEAQRIVAVLVAMVVVLGAFKAVDLLGHVPIVFGTFGTFLGVVYAARAYVDRAERNPDLHRALGDRHAKTGANPTPTPQDRAEAEAERGHLT